MDQLWVYVKSIKTLSFIIAAGLDVVWLFPELLSGPYAVCLVPLIFGMCFALVVLIQHHMAGDTWKTASKKAALLAIIAAFPFSFVGFFVVSPLVALGRALQRPAITGGKSVVDRKPSSNGQIDSPRAVQEILVKNGEFKDQFSRKRRASEILVNRSLPPDHQHNIPTQADTDILDRRPAQMATTIEIGQEHYTYSQETQQFLLQKHVSEYPKRTSVVIMSEPHQSSEGQFNLYKGLEAFFDSNPRLVKQTIFLSEGTEANKQISVEELIREEPYPTDATIRQVLQTFLITGYMAYEWKHQEGIPIVGTEDQGLYELSRRFASLCREDPNAVFQHSKYTDGTEYDIPLRLAWGFAVAARNKCIAQTLIEKIGMYENPMLFVAFDHVLDKRHGSEKRWDKIIKRNLIDVQHMGPMGALMFPWGAKGENWWLHHNVSDDCETFDIDHYLEEARVGYTFLYSKGEERATPEDVESYKRIFQLQREKRQ